MTFDKPLTREQKITQKRLVGEQMDLQKNRVHYYQVIQDTSNPFIFYFMLRGEDTDVYAGGYYIGRIELPKDYPKKPGFFYMLTPNGRFRTDSKICLTNSGYHLESWNALWSIRNMMLGFYSIFTADDTTGISHIRETSTARKQKAANSVQFNRIEYPEIFKRFSQYVKEDGTMRSDHDEIVKYINEQMELFQSSKKKKKDKKSKKHKKHRKDKKVDDNDAPKEEEKVVVKKTDDKIDIDDKEEEKVVVKKSKKTKSKTPKKKVVVKKNTDDAVPVPDDNPKVKTVDTVQITSIFKPDKTEEEDVKQMKKLVECENLNELIDLVKTQTLDTFNLDVYRTVEQVLC